MPGAVAHAIVLDSSVSKFFSKDVHFMDVITLNYRKMDTMTKNKFK